VRSFPFAYKNRHTPLLPVHFSSSSQPSPPKPSLQRSSLSSTPTTPSPLHCRKVVIGVFPRRRGTSSSRAAVAAARHQVRVRAVRTRASVLPVRVHPRSFFSDFTAYLRSRFLPLLLRMWFVVVPRIRKCSDLGFVLCFARMECLAR
jgi:hypothetical protein